MGNGDFPTPKPSFPYFGDFDPGGGGEGKGGRGREGGEGKGKGGRGREGGEGEGGGRGGKCPRTAGPFLDTLEPAARRAQWHFADFKTHPLGFRVFGALLRVRAIKTPKFRIEFRIFFRGNCPNSEERGVYTNPS